MYAHKTVWSLRKGVNGEKQVWMQETGHIEIDIWKECIKNNFEKDIIQRQT